MQQRQPRLQVSRRRCDCSHPSVSFTVDINCCSPISFLYDDQSPAYRLYQRKVQEYRAAGSKTSSLPAARIANLRQAATPQVHAAVNASSSPHSTEADNPPVKRKRKSRWGSEDERVELPIPQVVAPPDNDVPDPDAAALTGELIKILLL